MPEHPPPFPSGLDAQLRELYLGVAHIPFDRFQDFALEGLSRLVDFDRALWCQADAVSGLELTRWASTLKTGAAAHKGQRLDMNAMLLQALSGQTDDHALALCLKDTRRQIDDWLVLVRAPDARGFSARDRRLFRRAAPQLSAAWHLAQHFHLSQAAAKPLDQCCALLDRQGRLHAQQQGFQRLLQLQWPETRPDTLPASLTALLAEPGALDETAGFRIGDLVLTLTAAGPFIRMALKHSPQPAKLSRAEQAACRLYSLGRSYREIAHELGKAPATVRNQIASAYQKLGVANKTELALRLN